MIISGATTFAALAELLADTAFSIMSGTTTGDKVGTGWISGIISTGDAVAAVAVAVAVATEESEERMDVGSQGSTVGGITGAIAGCVSVTTAAADAEASDSIIGSMGATDAIGTIVGFTIGAITGVAMEAADALDVLTVLVAVLVTTAPCPHPK